MTDTAYRTFDVPVRGGALRVGEWRGGQQDGPIVLAVHGVTSSHLAWPWVARELLGAEGTGPRPARVLAPDLRGRGRSNGLPGPYGMAQHAEDLAAVVIAAGAGPGRPAVVVGHSMGAFASLVLADRFPDLVGSLVLVDGGFPLQTPQGVSRDEALEALLGPVLARLTQEFATPEDYVDSWRPHPAFAEAWTPEVEAYVRYDLAGEAPHLHPATVPEAIPDGNVDLYGGDVLLGALERLRVPAVFLRAERGFFDDPARLYPDEAMVRWRARYPSIRVKDVPGTNHYTIVMAADGARAVALSVREALGETLGEVPVQRTPVSDTPT